MWIKTQNGEFLNSDTVTRIACRKNIGTDEERNCCIYAENVLGSREEVFVGTAEQRDRLMSDISKAIAAEKIYFDVMKYFKEE